MQKVTIQICFEKIKETKYHHMNVEAFFDAVMNYQKTLEIDNPNLIEERIEYLLREQLERDPSIVTNYGGFESLRKSIRLFVEKDRPEVIEILRKKS